MIVHLIALIALAVLYGLAWHNRPAKERIVLDVCKAKREEPRQTIRPL